MTTGANPSPRGMTLLSPELTDYIAAHAPREPELFARLRAETYRDLEDPQMAIGVVEAALLGLLVRLTGARRILEVGTFSGYSGLAMAMALPEGGRLVTCDIDPVAAAVARRYFDESGHGHKITVELGPARKTLSRLAAAGERFDMAFIDADKSGYIAYYEAALEMMGPGGLVVADNTLWSGRVLDPRTDSARAIVAFNRHVRDDPRVDHVLLSVRDGVTLARKR